MRFLYALLGLDAPATIDRAAAWTLYATSAAPAVALAALAAVALAAACLNLLPHNVMRWRTRWTLLAVRLAGFAVLAAMLCRVELRLSVERTLRPTVAVLTDVSASMGLRDADGSSRLAAARAFAARGLAPLADAASLVPYRFSWRLEADAGPREPGGPSRLVEAVKEAARRESGLQAVVVLTDGHDSTGDAGTLAAPLLASRGLPVYPVVFGKADAPRMARVRLTGAESYVRLGDDLRLVARLSARKLGRQTVRVQLLEEGREQPLAVREAVPLSDRPSEVAFVTKPARAGRRRYRITMEGVRDSVSDRLLVAEHNVVVLDAKIRVLYLDIPRDERKLLGHWLARDPVIDLATLTLLPKGGWYAQGALRHANAGDGLPNQEADLCRYDVVVLGDIPRSYFRAGGDVAETKMQRLVEFVGRRGGGLITLGGQSVYAAGQYQDSALARILPFVLERTDRPQAKGFFRVSPTAMGYSHPLMQLEPDAEANRDAWLDLPPVEGCNRVERVRPGASLLAARPTDDGALPVVAVQNVGKGKVLSLAVDTTWHWEMKRPADSPDHFRRFWGNAVRFVAPDPRLRPHAPQLVRYQSASPVGERVTLATRLVDGTFRPIRGADLRVEATSPSGRATRIYPRDGRQAPGLYEFDVELDEPGTWRVATTFRGKTATEEIAAGESDAELDDPRAMPDAMARFAEATGGRAFRPDEADALRRALALRPGRRVETASVALWNLPATMLLLAALVCIDCFVRKRRGMV